MMPPDNLLPLMTNFVATPWLQEILSIQRAPCHGSHRGRNCTRLHYLNKESVPRLYVLWRRGQTPETDSGVCEWGGEGVD